jgi:methionyl-tRNA formyltransferase
MKTGVVSNSTLCIPLLHYLHSQQENVCVFSAEPVVQNAGVVASFCSSAGICCTHENSGRSLNEWIAVQQPDMVFVVGYNRKIAAGMHDLFNVHFGHLPQFRGADPVFWQLKKGMRTLAICIHRISESFDAGDVVWKKEYANEPFFSYGYVHQLLSHYLVEGVSCLLQMKKQGQGISGTTQNEQQAVVYTRPATNDCCIHWNNMPATEICDLIKACNPWNGGAIATYNGFEVRISDAEGVPCRSLNVANDMAHLAAGTIIDAAGQLLVVCINNEILKIHTLTVNGILMPARFAANYGFIRGQSFK